MNEPLLPERPIRRTEKASLLDGKIASVLEHMLEADEDIGYRAVMRYLPEISAVSSITRDEFRRDLVEQFRERQRGLRQWAGRAKKASQDDLADQLAAKDIRIRELETQIEILTASHKAMLLAVGETGGMVAWKRFFENHQAVLASLDRRTTLSIVKD